MSDGLVLTQVSAWTTEEPTANLRWWRGAILGGTPLLEQEWRVIHYVNGVADRMESEWRLVRYDDEP